MNQEKRERNKNKAYLQELGHINISQNPRTHQHITKSNKRNKKIFVERFKERKYAC